MKTKMIVLGGCDKTGKTSLRELLHKTTNYRHLIIERLIDGNIVYGKVFKRSIIEEELLEWDQRLALFNNDILFVYLYAPGYILKKRFIECKEEFIQSDQIQKILNEYMRFTKITRFKHVLSFNTSLFSQKNIVSVILKYIEANMS